jgi:outer membrane murein-binding lipoprotein Lpp
MMCARWFGYLDTERILMKKLHTLVPAAAVAVSLLVLGGCATKGDIESLRSEIAGLRSSIESVDAKATRADANSQRAAADAAQAEAAANAASQKADQIFRAGLRK